MIGDYAAGEQRSRARRRNSARTCLHFRLAIRATLVVFVVAVLLVVLYVSSSDADLASTTAEVCEQEVSSMANLKVRGKWRDEVTIRLKRQLYDEVLSFQQRSFGAETLPELLRMPSRWSSTSTAARRRPRVTVILNHFKRRTLCAQLEQLRRQTLPFHRVWVLSFGSPNEAYLRRVVEGYNDSRVSFVSSDYNFKYYGRFQMALQSDDADYVYVVDDDMIPGARMLEILCHVAGTEKYANAVLGSIGRILPFRQMDLNFPRYREFRSREAGLYLPDRDYGLAVDRVVRVDFLCSSWFLPAGLVKALIVETPLTFATGEDLHLSYMLRKYAGAGSFVLPVDAGDRDTWGDTDHRLARVFPTTSTSMDMVRARDEQWWRALTSGYVTQWAAMHPQKVDALMYAHTLAEVRALAPLVHRFRSSTLEREAYLVVYGRCREAAAVLGWPEAVCKERRFNIFGVGARRVPVMQAVYAGMRGILRMLNPSVVVALDDIDGQVKEALRMAATNRTALVLLPRRSVSKVLWMATLDPASLPRSWKKYLIDMMYLRGYLTLYPNFPNQSSFSTNHMEPGVHIGARDNVHKHRKIDYEVPLIDHDFATLLPMGKLPPASELPVLNLFNQAVSIKGLKAAGAKLGQDVLNCGPDEIVAVGHINGLPTNCTVI